MFVRLASVTYFAYLDEFGHIGPYVSKKHPKYKESPVFGLAGFILPSKRVRNFGTWFFQRKLELLSYEINDSEKHPANWEKKGSSLYTVKNVNKYEDLRHFTNRLFNKVKELDGFIFYVGRRKHKPPDTHKPNLLYEAILAEAIRRIDQYCELNCKPSEDFILILDHHDQREKLITKTAKVMYGKEPKRRLIEPLFQVESHLYQTMQAADWIAGLVGRLEAYWADSNAYAENRIFHKYFQDRLNEVSRRSGVS